LPPFRRTAGYPLQGFCAIAPQGSAGEALGEPGLQQPQGPWLGQAALGFRKKGAKRWCRTHVVLYSHPAYQEVWVLAAKAEEGLG
jgi:hypothetical protein